MAENRVMTTLIERSLDAGMILIKPLNMSSCNVDLNTNIISIGLTKTNYFI